jgi:hypothetical protein
MSEDIDIDELESAFLQELQKQIEMILYSELSLLEMAKPKELKIDLEYRSDYGFYMNKFWFSLPYPKSRGIGMMNITS